MIFEGTQIRVCCFVQNFLRFGHFRDFSRLAYGMFIFFVLLFGFVMIRHHCESSRFLNLMLLQHDRFANATNTLNLDGVAEPMLWPRVHDKGFPHHV